MNLSFLPPIMVPVGDYSAPQPQLAQPVFALKRSGSEVWAVPLVLNPSDHDWAKTDVSDLVRVPLHSPSGGYNTPEARDISLVAASMAFAMEAMCSLWVRNRELHDPSSAIAVQLVLGDAVHLFAPGELGPNTPAMFRFYVGMAFRLKA